MRLKQIPDPTNKTGQDNETDGFGGLAKQLEFMMLKMVQLETLCEMQQYEIETLRLKVKEHDKILSKDHEGLIQLPERDPETHLKKAQETMERVAVKHSKQLTTRNFHPSHSAPEPKKAKSTEQVLLEKRQESSSNSSTGCSWRKPCRCVQKVLESTARLVNGQWVGTANELANSYQDLLDHHDITKQIAFLPRRPSTVFRRP